MKLGDLSVVIIGRNEELHIEKCIQSVLRGTESFDAPEIIYVDSASTDGTVQTAKQYPIKIIQLRPEWKLSAPAGRYIGYHHTSGRYIFFIDGDTILYKKWLSIAVSFMSERPDIAGVAGVVHEVFTDSEGNILGNRKNRYLQQNKVSEVQTFGGIALYRRSVLEEVGSFNPHIADEERELGLRIRKAGYKIVRIYSPMAITYAYPRETVSEILRRAHSGLYSFGATLRYCLKNGLFWQYLTERLSFIFTFIFGVLVSTGILILFILSNNLKILISLCIGIAIILFSLKRKDIRGIFISLFKRVLISYKIIQTFLTTTPKPPESYPMDVIVIKDQEQG